MKRYNSKISGGILVPLIVTHGLVLTIMLIERIWIGAFLVGLLIAFITHMYLTTYYTIKDSLLLIRCGFLFNKKVEISDITKIKESNNALSSPALSLDRLEVCFNKRGGILISPREKEEFVRHLQRINPAIEFTRKAKPSFVSQGYDGV